MAKTQKHYNNNYTQLDNSIVDDSTLSFKCLGLWLYMWRQPDDWYFTAELIASNRKEGINSINSGLKQLEEAGYLKREYQYRDGRIENIVYHLADTPRYKEENQSATKRSTIIISSETQ